MIQESQCPAELTVALQELCLWSDQSMGWDDPDIEQEDDAIVDKEACLAGKLHWEYVPAAIRGHDRCRHSAFSLLRVRLPLSELHPSLRDIEFWTLDLRSTVVLFLVLLVLVSFGAALFA